MALPLVAAGGMAVWGMFTKSKELEAKNEALAAQAQFEIEKYNAQEILTKFAQANNQLRANEITQQIAQEEAAAKRDVSVEGVKAVSQEVIRRGEGVTAGASVQRTVDEVIKARTKAMQGVETQGDKAVSQVQLQARQANAKEQINLVNSYNNLLMTNAQLAGQMVTGTNAMLQIIGQGLQGAQSGFNLGTSLSAAGVSLPSGGAGGSTPKLESGQLYEGGATGWYN